MITLAYRLRHAAGEALLSALIWTARTVDHHSSWCALIGHQPIWTGSTVAYRQCHRPLGQEQP